jgi:hypothetical protein
MLIVYLTTYATVTSAPATEPAVDAATTIKSPSREIVYGRIPLYDVMQDNPSYLYPYPQTPYQGDSRSGLYYPQNGWSGYPWTAANGYPQYGYPIPSGYPYGTGYQYSNFYRSYPYKK